MEVGLRYGEGIISCIYTEMLTKLVDIYIHVICIVGWSGLVSMADGNWRKVFGICLCVYRGGERERWVIRSKNGKRRPRSIG